MTLPRPLPRLSWPMLATFGRRHAPFLVLLTVGAVLRGVTFLAYRPALIYFDSIPYLANAASLEPFRVRPIGYPLFLRILPIENELAVVPFVQHLMGLLIAVVLYMLLTRLGVRRWLAALATAPVLLDGYQLNIEQQILSETLFDLMIVTAVALLLWRRPLGLVPAGLAGLLFSATALTRASALIIVVPVILTLVFLRERPSRVAALLAVFALPLAAYAIWYQSIYGTYSITGFGGRFLYARVAPFADCTKFSVPVKERVLCPKQPVGQRPTIEEFMWSKKLSPVHRVEVPEGKTLSGVAGGFAKRVIRHQPVEYTRRVAVDFLHSFAPTKRQRAGDLPVSRWQFQRTYPIYRPERTQATLVKHGDKRPRVRPRLASFLRTYQRYAYTPGPLLGVALLVALAAAAGLGRARGSGLQSATFLFAGLLLIVMLPTIAVNQFTWRYQLPQLVLLPAAGVLGLTALTRRKGAGKSDDPGPTSDSGSAESGPGSEPDGVAVAGAGPSLVRFPVGLLRRFRRKGTGPPSA